MKLRGLTGIVPVRNGNSLGYCWKLAVESMLPICDEVIICDGESTDGTAEDAREMSFESEKIRLISYPWDNPVGDHWFLSRWINYGLKEARYDMQCQLDADEVLDPSSYPMMRLFVKERKPAWFHRVNLWADPQHEAPHGTVCAHECVRLGPIEHPAVCDNLHPVEPWVNLNSLRHPSLRIWHLGFLRNQPQFLKKAREIQRMLINTFDPNLAACEATGENWVKKCPFPPEKPLIVHGIELPEIIKPWLRAQGHSIP
jgi:hypothetical protein